VENASVSRPDSDDPFIREVRGKIADNDRAIVAAINDRLKLVARLKAYKDSRGLDFVDRAQEDWIYTYLARVNSGPLSDEGLREIIREILDLTKREVSRGA
jgi:chorismate mutase / prephenate dehydratase